MPAGERMAMRQEGGGERGGIQRAHDGGLERDPRGWARGVGRSKVVVHDLARRMVTHGDGRQLGHE